MSASIRVRRSATSAAAVIGMSLNHPAGHPSKPSPASLLMVLAAPRTMAVVMGPRSCCSYLALLSSVAKHFLTSFSLPLHQRSCQCSFLWYMRCWG